MASGQEGTFLPRVHSAARSHECMFKCYVEADVFCCNKHKTLHASPKELFSSTHYYPWCKRNLSLGLTLGRVEVRCSSNFQWPMPLCDTPRAHHLSFLLSSGVSPATGTQLSPQVTPPSPLSSTWVALPSAADWVINTTKCGYTI